MAYGTVNADVIQSSVANTSLGAGNASIMKNRIINGAMVIDQRNAGASVTPSSGTSVYTLDRWQAYVDASSCITVQQSSTAPAGFVNSLLVTSTAATTPSSGQIYLIRQKIEGYNIADLGWGTADAKSITISFWVRSSLTGTFGGVLKNSAENRTYAFTYTISAANTWEQKTITVAGDTSGTWLTTNGVGIYMSFSLGAGSSKQGTANTWSASNIDTATGATNFVATNGATLYITGVQLEVGSSATGFEYRQIQQELALCQRYFEICNLTYTSYANGSNNVYVACPFKSQKRATPTMTNQGTSYGGYTVTSITINASVPDFADNFTNVFQSVSSGGTNSAGFTRYATLLTASAEL